MDMLVVEATGMKPEFLPPGMGMQGFKKVDWVTVWFCLAVLADDFLEGGICERLSIPLERR